MHRSDRIYLSKFELDPDPEFLYLADFDLDFHPDRDGPYGKSISDDEKEIYINNKETKVK